MNNEVTIDRLKQNKIKTWLSANKVCFITNSISMPSSLLIPSLKTYIDCIPIQNFWLIPGFKGKEPFYGLNAFLEMYQYMLSNHHFDYAIYIDEDCFITDIELLIEEFRTFINGDYCLAGCQDGGVFCHRNHSKKYINTFLSFWNFKLLREKQITFKDILEYITEVIKDQNNSYRICDNKLREKNKVLYEFINDNSDKMLKKLKEFREKTISGNNHESPYAEVVKNDKNNVIEAHQVPYTYDDNTAKGNFEPYYILEQALVYLTERPIYYFFCGDLYNDEYVKNNESFDLSGLTSAVYTHNNKHNLIAVHTWFSRAYTKWPSLPLQLEHTKRINTIIKKFSKI